MNPTTAGVVPLAVKLGAEPGSADVSPVPAFRILGPVEIVGAAGVVPVPPGRQQAVLALLLLDATQVVSTDHVIDVLWDHEPPDTARTQVQICVSRLRKSLTAFRTGATIHTRAPGYVLEVDSDQIDARVFADLVTQARGLNDRRRHDEAAAALHVAMNLWRGPSLSGIDNPALRMRAMRLDEDRLDAGETLYETELQLGHHHRLVGTLARLVREHPLRERLRMLLMLALYRAGRQAEALDTYRTGRELLISRLGLEPSEALRSLETAILADAPELQAPAIAELGGPEPEPAALTLPAHLAVETAPAAPLPPVPPRPRQLPADTADFVTDDAVLAAAEVGLVNAGGILAVVGAPGVGKSAFAVHVGHRLADRYFPDGQLYCTIGDAPDGVLDTTEILGLFLNALGIPGPMIPAAAAGRGEMYRTLLADRRMLVVIDGATSEGQVVPLLPGSGPSALLVTSRFRLGAIPGVVRIELDNLPQAQALTLLERVAGAERVRQEPEAASMLVRAVAGLPLAVRIIGARLAARPHWTLASMVARLSDEQRLLDELSHGEMTIRASLSMTYDSLDPASRDLFALLGLVDGPSLPAWVAGAVLGDRRARPSDLLDPLIDVQLLGVLPGTGGGLRYRFQDVIRVFARERLLMTADDATGTAAMGRLLGGWLAMARRAHSALHGGDYTVLHGTAPLWQPPTSELARLVDDPMGVLDVERANLRAAIAQAARAGMHELCWDLAVTSTTLFEARGYLDDWEQTHQTALLAVRTAGNVRGTAAVLASLGTLYLTTGRAQQARTVLETALRSFEELDEPLGLGLCRRDLALMRRQSGDDAAALELYARSVIDFDRAGDVVGRAIVLTQRAEILARHDQLAAAHDDLALAIGIQEQLGYIGGVARTKRRIGLLQSAAGEHDRAIATLNDVLEMVTAQGDVIGEAHLLRNLGEAEAAGGRLGRATEHFTRALAVCEQIMDRPGAARVSTLLESLTAADPG